MVKSHSFTLDLIKNNGKMASSGALKCEADKIIQDLSTSQIVAEQSLSVTAKTLLQNNGVLSGESTDLKVTDKTQGIFLQSERSRTFSKKKMSISGHTVNNSGFIKSQFGDLALKDIHQFSNLKTGVLESLESLNVKVSECVNNGTLKSRVIDCHAQTIVQETKESKMLAEKLKLHATETTENNGTLWGEAFTESVALKGLTNYKEAVLGSNGDLHITQTPEVTNHGKMMGKHHFKIDGSTTLQNTETGELTSDWMAYDLNIKSKNDGVMAGKKLVIQGKDFENSKTGKITVETLNFDNTFAANRGLIEVSNFHIKTNTALDAMPLYSFLNTGDIVIKKGDFTFVGQGISHTAGSIKTNHTISITATNILLLAETVANNIALHHGGGIWVVKDTVKALGELSFHFPEGKVITEAREVVGALKYAISPAAKKPLVFEAKQTTKNGHLIIESPTAITIGSDSESVSLMSTQEVIITGQQLYLKHGRLAGRDLKLDSKSDILLGTDKNYCALGSVNDMHFNATGNITWHHLELACGKNLSAKGLFLEDIASHIHIVGDATLDMPKGKHGLLTTYQVNGYDIPWRDWDRAFYSYKTIGPSEQPLTAASKLQVEGKLTLTGQMDIIGSQVSCGLFEGVRPTIRHFIPYRSFKRAYFCGHKDVNKCHWEWLPHIGWEYQYGNAFLANFSIGSDLKSAEGLLDIRGIVSALSIVLENIDNSALIGQSLDLTLKLPPPKPFRTHIPLMEYAKPTMLFEMKEGHFSTIYQPIIPFNVIGALGPIIVKEGDSLRPNIHNYPCLFFPLQERAFLVEAMMDGLYRHFIGPDLTEPQAILRFLKDNAERYMEAQQKGLKPETPLLMVVYQEILFTHTSGHQEITLVPDLYLSQTLDNPRLRDWAGGLFALEGGIALKGKNQTSSSLQITGHMDAKELVTYEDFNIVSRARRTITRYETVTQVTTQKSLLGKKKTTVDIEHVPVTELQPGNETHALGEHYIHVNHVHRVATVDTLGKESLKVQQAKTFVDEAIVQNQIGPQTQTKQKGLLGLGGTTTYSQAITLKAIGSVIHSSGPIHIEAQYGQLDATQFKRTDGNEPEVHFEIEALHFHELLKRVEAQNKERALALAEQARTAKRKRKQGNILLLVSLPISYYMGGLASGWLQGFIGSNTLMAAKGFVMGATGAAIRRQKLLRGSLEGALFSRLGYGIEHSSRLSSLLPGVTKDIVKGMTVAAVQTALHGGNLPENVITGGVAPGVAGKVFPNEDEVIPSTLLESGTAVLLSHGTAEDLAMSLGQSAFGASVGKKLFEVGSRQGYKMGLTSVKKTSKTSLNPTATHTQKTIHTPSQTELLKFATKKASQVLSKAGVYVSDKEIQSAFKTHPALQGSEKEINAKLIKLGRVPGSKDTSDAFLRGLQKVFDTTLMRLVHLINIGEVRTENLNRFKHDKTSYTKQKKEVIAWLQQQDNRQRFPTLARESDALQAFKTIKSIEGLGSGIKDSFVESGQFLGEEVGRLRLGEQTKTGMAVKAVGTFIGEEAARVSLKEQTQTERFARAVGAFMKEEVNRFQLGEQTKTQTLIFRGMQKLSEMPAEKMLHHLGKGIGDVLVGRGVAQGLKLAGKVVEGVALEIITGNPRPKSLLFTQGGFISIGGVTLDELKKRDFALGAVLNNAQRGVGPVQITSVTDAMRLNVELALKQANILNTKGELTEYALSNTLMVTEGKKLSNPMVITELTKNGSKMKDWAKYTTKEAVLLPNGQKIQVHFYKNKHTGEINTNIDYKTTPAVFPSRVYPKKQ